MYISPEQKAPRNVHEKDRMYPEIMRTAKLFMNNNNNLPELSSSKSQKQDQIILEEAENINTKM